ncbi:hypothetical protein QWY86_09075 [Pedobacter aquatilis]|uniref:hypothetical protein n=1 Tax=Pedobacter aquatilis TaxID=351343 RepID=UPI0025B29E15|nr:hypothetical protein [Pedobacter aquatilis]MDN3586817.1 hypothetical protein [Pedobacter aquatilis]
MKRIFILTAAISVLLFSCQSDSKKYTTVDSSIMSDEVVKYNSPDECFTYSKNNDNVSLLIYGTGDNKVLGKLNYNLDGKDKNEGSFYGYTVGDTIIVDYKFQSEGVWSKRQVAWIRQGDKFLEGYGETYQDKDIVKFKNYRKLTYGNSIVLEKTDCK